MNNRFTAAVLLMPLALTLTGCKDKTVDVGHKTETSTTSNSGNTSQKNSTTDTSNAILSTPKGLNKTPSERGGNYYEVMGKATFDNYCNIPAGGYNYRGVINGAGQVGPACAKVTEKHKRVEPIADPAGFKYNGKATIAYLTEPGKSYKGYFYNRSHMISAALGGSPKAENLVTGTRMQNVGESNKGGMRETEAKAEKYVVSATAKSCPLTYEVTPHYRNTTDAVPTWVEVNMQSCDKSLDEKVAVFNDANGYTIDYATGKWNKN